jgi:putative sugar O-methyltransferase
MKQDIQLLDFMMEDQIKQKGIYSSSTYWQGYAKRMEYAIRNEGLDNFRANTRISKGYGDSMVINPLDLLPLDSFKSRLYKKIVQFPYFYKSVIESFAAHNNNLFSQMQKYKNLYYSHTLGEWFLKFSNTYSLPETLIGNPQRCVSINNYKIGESYLSVFFKIYNFASHIDFTKVNTIFEIGGGFGAFTHTLLHFFPNIKKVIYLDIPPVLYVGTQYLKHFFDSEVIDYRQTKNLDKITFSSDDKREIFAICPWQIEHIDTKIDLFVNFASFQEMNADIVKNYILHVHRMLTNNTSKVCIFITKLSAKENVLIPEQIQNIIESNTSIKLQSITPELEIVEGRYFLGNAM